MSGAMVGVFLQRVEDIIADVTFRPDNYGFDTQYETASNTVWIQVRCYRRDTFTGEFGTGYGGWRPLKPHMTDSQIVRIIFGSCMAYDEHEVREAFQYKGKRIFGPHIDVDALVRVADDIEVRPARTPEQPRG